MKTYNEPPLGASHDTSPHWCPRSETYFTGDKLVSAIQSGWEIEPIVHTEEVGVGNGRHVNVLHFYLQKGDKWVHMRIIETPYLNRFIAQNHFHVMPYTVRKDAEESSSALS